MTCRRGRFRSAPQLGRRSPRGFLASALDYFSTDRLFRRIALDRIIRILVVDDFEPWRQFVSSFLSNLPPFHVVGEASDGLDAVLKVRTLQPDIVILDVGLPKLNGIEAARKICEIHPHTKIVLLTEESSVDVIREGLRTAKGYVIKRDAIRDLLPALHAVLRGEVFADGKCGQGHFDSSEENSDGVKPISSAHEYGRTRGRHEVAFYPNDATFEAGFANSIAAALNLGHIVLVVATQLHYAGIVQKLQADNVDVSTALSQGRYSFLASSEILSKVMFNGMPDPDRCAKVIDNLIVAATTNAGVQHRRVSIFGECAPILLAQGDAEAAIQLEHLWGEVTAGHNADTLCGYLSTIASPSMSGAIFERICAEHSAAYSGAP